MNIYVVRHGQTDWNKKNVLLGSTDLPLNETGEKQAIELKNKLEGINFQVIFSSDLKRARKTAQIISDDRIPIIKTNQLQERNYGKMEGTTPENIGMYWDIKKNLTDNAVESLKDFLTRVFSSMDMIIDKTKDADNILIVTHYGVVMAIDAYFNEKYDYCFDNFFIDNCEYKKYSINRG